MELLSIQQHNQRREACQVPSAKPVPLFLGLFLQFPLTLSEVAYASTPFIFVFTNIRIMDCTGKW